MQTVNEVIRVLRRQEELEIAIRRPGGIPCTEEQELVLLRQMLAEHPGATQAVVDAARALRRSVTAVTAREVVEWANVAYQQAATPEL